MSKKSTVDEKSIPLDPTTETNLAQERQQQQQQEGSTLVNTNSNISHSNNNNNNNEIRNSSSNGILQDSSIRVTTLNSSLNHSNNTSDQILSLTEEQQRKAEMMADEDPLLISQSLTYVTDDGGVLHSFQSAPFSLGTFI
jgi:hypothetical protein